MKCPKCKGKLKTVDSRHRNNNKIYRRKECLKCKLRYTTCEFIPEEVPKITLENVNETLIQNTNVIENFMEDVQKIFMEIVKK